MQLLLLLQVSAALQAARKYLVIDFSRVRGLDATGARTFSTVCHDLADLGITPVFTRVAHSGIRELLRAHAVPLRRETWPPDLLLPLPGAAGAADGASEEDEEEEGQVLEFETLEEGLRWVVELHV